MTARTTKSTVTFVHPFTLGELDEVLPSGTYDVETDEDLIEGLSFQVYRRTKTLFHVPDKSGKPGLARTLTIHPDVLDDAMERDALSNP